MDSTVDSIIQQATAEAKAGNKAKAANTLIKGLEVDKKDVRIWYLLSQVLDDKDQKLKCLLQAQRLQPDNPQIKEKLDLLGGPPSPPPQGPASQPDAKPDPASRTLDDLKRDPKRKLPWWVYALAGVVVLCAACSCAGFFYIRDAYNKAMDSFIERDNLPHTVTYRIEGNPTQAEISYMNDRMGMEQGQYISPPWEKSYEMSSGAQLAIQAKYLDPSTGPITCIITVDGKEVYRNTSSSRQPQAVCAGMVGLKLDLRSP